MIKIGEYTEKAHHISFIRDGARMFAADGYQETNIQVTQNECVELLVGTGKEKVTLRNVKELLACAAKKMKAHQITSYQVDMAPLIRETELSAICFAIQGIYEGIYEVQLPGEREMELPEVTITGVEASQLSKAEAFCREGIALGEAQTWVRHMVNAPGNLFHPMDFARTIMEKMEETPVSCELLVYSKLNAMGMHALTSVGKSSENPPCLLIMSYEGNPGGEVTGLVGKGVTCDTGGYCLKPANSMMGIKGDMAGGAAVAATMYALAKQKAAVNVVAAIPMCENRISTSSLVPGDVISSYSGKKIEICNTDAEGRLVLADAVSYLVKEEKVDRILDIATLTGAVVNMFGFSTAGTLGNDENFYREFERGFEKSGERYWRLPIYEEQEKMIESEIADIKNMGRDYCGTITAGLFVRAFTEGKPWIHVDIAGTAWIDSPLYTGQPKGATGAAVSTLYYMMKEKE